MLDWFDKTPTVKIIIYLLFGAHIFFAVQSIFDGWTIISKDWFTWYPFIVVWYALSWGLCLLEKKWAYYLYLISCFVQIALIIYSLRFTNDDALKSFCTTFFPLNIIFGFLLLIDIKRLFTYAPVRKSSKK